MTNKIITIINYLSSRQSNTTKATWYKTTLIVSRKVHPSSVIGFNNVNCFECRRENNKKLINIETNVATPLDEKSDI